MLSTMPTFCTGKNFLASRVKCWVPSSHLSHSAMEPPIKTAATFLPKVPLCSMKKNSINDYHFYVDHEKIQTNRKTEIIPNLGYFHITYVNTTVVGHDQPALGCKPHQSLPSLENLRGSVW